MTEPTARHRASSTVQTVTATLRIIAEQVERETDRQWLLGMTEAIDGPLADTVCPLCHEATCDDRCPLRAARAIAMQEPCGFIHNRWIDGIYRERRRCIAKAGHTTGQFVSDHGPWESAQ